MGVDLAGVDLALSCFGGVDSVGVDLVGVDLKAPNRILPWVIVIFLLSSTFLFLIFLSQ